jgi:hypothetical protein
MHKGEVMGRKAWVFAMLMIVFFVGPAHGALLTVQPPGDTSQFNFWPANNIGMRWQQVYDDSFFGSSAVTINSLAFFAMDTGTISYGSSFLVRLSTTATEPGSLSTTFNNNLGADLTTVFSGPVTLVSVQNTWNTIAFTTPFDYDPSLGNLLVEISHDPAVSGVSLHMMAYQQTPIGLERVAFDSFGSGSSLTQGVSFGFGELVTRFDVSAASATVPEPSSFVSLIGLGLSFLGLRKRRRH